MRTTAALAFLALATVLPCVAQSFPSKPITVIGPFGPGGNPDFCRPDPAAEIVGSIRRSNNDRK